MVNMEYAVRGKVVNKAAELQSRLEAGEAPGDFTELVRCNIGNPHAVKQPPVSFYREVASALYHPKLMEKGVLDGSGLYAADVLQRAREYHACTGGNGMGAYTDSIGLKLVREQVAAFIEERDGYPCNPAHLALTTGASEGVKRTLGALVRGPHDAILIPRPQYPLYSASVTMFGGRAVYYDLDESVGWTVGLAELERSAKAAKDAQGCTGARALCVINPGNPVGAVLGESDVAMMICFAAKRGLVLLADEVHGALCSPRACPRTHSLAHVLIPVVGLTEYANAARGASPRPCPRTHSLAHVLVPVEGLTEYANAARGASPLHPSGVPSQYLQGGCQVLLVQARAAAAPGREAPHPYRHRRQHARVHARGVGPMPAHLVP
jgi:aspartate/methionine/tyrosine aminotransferase